MLKQKGYLNINLIVLVAVLVMVSYWLIAAPKVDILKTVRNLPKLTIQKLVPGNTNQQNSQVTKKPVVDKQAAAKLLTQSIKNSSDLEKIGRDLDSTSLDNLDNPINQIDTNIDQ